MTNLQQKKIHELKPKNREFTGTNMMIKKKKMSTFMIKNMGMLQYDGDNFDLENWRPKVTKLSHWKVRLDLEN
jgi:hypothetical protein